MNYRGKHVKIQGICITWGSENAEFFTFPVFFSQNETVDLNPENFECAKIKSLSTYDLSKYSQL